MPLAHLNDFVDHIYVITLERETDRQTNITKCLEGLNYSFFFGVDKKNLVIDNLIAEGIYDEEKTIRHHRFDKPMNTGQIGTSWSHRLVYEDMLSKGYEKVLILEDDISPCKDGLEFMTAALETLPPDWEMIYFDSDTNLSRNFGTWIRQLGYHIRSFFGRMKWSHGVIKNIYARKFSDNLLLAGMHDCSSAYAITKGAAKKLVALQTPISFLSSGLLSHAVTNNLLNAYVYNPRAFQKDLRFETKTLIS